MPEHREQKKNFRLVEFIEILAMTNNQGRKKGEIAITILSPNQTIHARLIDEEIDSHKILATEVYSCMFQNANEDPSHFTIEMRHFAKSDNARMCCIYMPSYITPREFEDLSELLNIMYQNGIGIHSMTTDFDPRTQKDVPTIKSGVELGDKEILNYLTSQNKIADYKLPFEEIELGFGEEKSKRV